MKTVKQIITFILILCLLSTIGLSAFTDNFIELSTGSSGNEVFKLQKHLTELAYSTNGIDGWHGDGTKNAVGMA